MEKRVKKSEGTEESAGGFLGGLFKGLGTLVDLAEKLEKEGGVIRRQGEIRGLGKRLSSLDQLRRLEKGKDIRGVYGFTIRTGIAERGRPRVEPFGNVKETRRGPVIDDVREPMVDVFEEKNALLIVAEVPGVEEKSITTALKGQTLTIDAGKGDLRYRKKITLPSVVDPESRKQSYKNGILKLEFRIKK